MSDVPDTSYASEDRGPVSLGVTVSLTALSTAFVVARLFVRIKLLRNVGLDDYLIAGSMVNLHPPASQSQPTLTDG